MILFTIVNLSINTLKENANSREGENACDTTNAACEIEFELKARETKN